MFSWRLTAIKLKDGTTVQTDAAHLLGVGSVTLLIGPNGGGKSTLLREMDNFFKQTGPERLILESASSAAGGLPDELVSWAKEHFPEHKMHGPHGSGDEFLQLVGNVLRSKTIHAFWGGSGSNLKPLMPLLLHRLGTENRLVLGNYTRSRNRHTDPPTAYVHVLQASPSLESKVRDEVRAAFGQDLLINWGAGQTVGFHVGIEPKGENKVDPDYLTALGQLPLLDECGDGLRSFVACVLAAVCGSQPVLLIDEPEAFLHPTQSFRLAKLLARSAEDQQRQIIIATHSTDVVRGVVQNVEHASVWRVTRGGAGTNIAILPSEEVRRITSRPIVGSAAVLQGLFRDAVVVCESDGDCRFYESLMFGLAPEKTRGVDAYFIHGNGKGQLARLVAVYRALKVPVAVIADIDVLRDGTELDAVLAALGTTPAGADGLYRTVRAALENQPPTLSPDTAAKELATIADRWRNAKRFDSEGIRKLLDVARTTGTWSEAKRYGIGKLRGEPRRQAEELLERWRTAGLHVVPFGELEGWWPNGPTEKNEWLSGALGRMRSVPEEFREARAFVQCVSESLAEQQ